MKPNPHRLNLDIYPFQFEMTPRFGDVDPQRHLNNARLAEYYQEGRVRFYQALENEFDFRREPGRRTLVAHLSIDFLDEVRYPDRVRVGVGVMRVGASSHSLGLAMFQNGRCVGLAMTVMVHAGKEGSMPVPDRLREILEKKMLPQEART